MSDSLSVLALAELLDELGSREGTVGRLRVFVEVDGLAPGEVLGDGSRLKVVDVRRAGDVVVLEAYPVA